MFNRVCACYDRTVDKCDDGWLGHRLVSRCYYMELELKTMSEARAHCFRHGGVLATVDTAFYNNVTALLLDRVSARHSRLGKTDSVNSLTLA